MVISDFEPVPDKEPGWWRAKSPLLTPSGEFHVRLYTDKGTEQPSDEILRHINALVGFAKEHHRKIFAELHEDYQFAAETEGFLESLDVPQGLTQDQLGPYAGPVGLAVRPRDPDGYYSIISTSPRWNEEHGCDFLLENGQLERIEY